MTMSTSTLQKVLDILNDSAGISDRRMNRFLMKSPLQLISILVLYLAVIFKIGPNFMKNRKPFSLRYVMIGYNLIQIVANVVTFLTISPLWKDANIFCTPPDTSNSEKNLLELKGHYYYVLLKYFDLIETFLFVLRKKDKQVSLLHVHHHIGILLAAWISGKYFPGGQANFVGFYNTFIHCLMYYYYLVTSWNPNSAGVAWKKYITALQIIQLCLILISVLPVVVNVNCSYPKFWMALFSLNVLFNVYQFCLFYKKAYLRKTKRE